MKKFSKILSVALLVALVLSLGVANAFAASITINRDDSWDEDAEAANATYTYYKIFDAEITSAGTVNETAGALTTEGNVVYTISGDDAAAKVAVLPSIFKADLAADGKYYITLADESTGAADIVAALKTMVEANTTLFPGTAVISDDAAVELDVGTDGYYLILASNGKNAAVQTIGDVTIKEKNDYPTIDKKQKKEADPSYTEAEIPAEIGTYIDYQVTVHIPADANKAIYVVDTMSKGLEYDATAGLTLTPEVAYTEIPADNAQYNADATWQIMFSAETVTANRDSDIVITYRALVTEDALVDTGRENEVTLVYDEGNYVLKDKVDFETYFTGIEKVDGKDDTIKLEGVEFTLTVGDTAFNVKPVLKGGDGDDADTVLYYVPDENGSNVVVTGKDGKIIIRGLDNTVNYVLTETKTNAGYNLLKDPKELKGDLLVKDTGDVYTTTTFDQIVNNSGTQLPSTGGIGTTIFYAVGGVLVLAAIILLVTKKRMSE